MFAVSLAFKPFLLHTFQSLDLLSMDKYQNSGFESGSKGDQAFVS